MISPPDNYNVLNGFKRPEDVTNPVNNLDNQLFIYGSVDLAGLLFTATKFQNVIISNDILVVTTSIDIPVSGMILINAGTGGQLIKIEEVPSEGAKLDILLNSITSGSVTVKTYAGTTFDGVNNTATFDAVGDELVIGYSSATQWQIFKNNSVTLSVT